MVMAVRFERQPNPSRIMKSIFRATQFRPSLLQALVLCLASVPLLLAGPAWGRAQSPVGVWATEGNKSHIEIYRCGEHMCGKIIWLDRAKSRGPAFDRQNPDPSKRGRPLVGLRVLSELRPSDDPGEWTGGRVYDPRDGDSYRVKMTLLQDGRMRVRAYIGIPLIGRSQTWTRVR